MKYQIRLFGVKIKYRQTIHMKRKKKISSAAVTCMVDGILFCYYFSDIIKYGFLCDSCARQTIHMSLLLSKNTKKMKSCCSLLQL